MFFILSILNRQKRYETSTCLFLLSASSSAVIFQAGSQNSGAGKCIAVSPVFQVCHMAYAKGYTLRMYSIVSFYEQNFWLLHNITFSIKPHMKCSLSFKTWLMTLSNGYRLAVQQPLYRVSLHLAEKHFPENHLPEKHFPERSFSRINIFQKSHLPE